MSTGTHPVLDFLSQEMEDGAASLRKSTVTVPVPAARQLFLENWIPNGYVLMKIAFPYRGEKCPLWDEEYTTKVTAVLIVSSFPLCGNCLGLEYFTFLLCEMRVTLIPFFDFVEFDLFDFDMQWLKIFNCNVMHKNIIIWKREWGCETLLITGSHVSKRTFFYTG